MTKNKGKVVSHSLTNIEKSKAQNDLRQLGYLLPTNDKELAEFEKIYGKTQVMFPEHLKEPKFLKAGEPHIVQRKIEPAIRSTSKKVKGTIKAESSRRVSKNDYFKKLVLAAEIANQLHQEPTFGHLKFVKIQYLCDQVCQMKLSYNFGKHAAGPLDGKQMHMIDAEFKKRKWFEIAKTDFRFSYSPGENIGDYKRYYSNYFGSHAESIERIINLFRKQKSEFCEIVATIFFLWNDFHLNHKLINNASLIKEFYAWDVKKRRFSETQIIEAIEWMSENGITPVFKMT